MKTENKTEKKKPEKKNGERLTCSRAQQRSPTTQPSPSPAAAQLPTHVPLRQKNEGGVVLIFFLAWQTARRRASFLLGAGSFSSPGVVTRHPPGTV
jgi:hypothetical protein